MSDDRQIEMFGVMTSDEREAVFVQMRWVKVPSTVPSTKIEGLYSKLGKQDMMLGLYTHSLVQKQIQYVTKPIGQKVTLIFGPETVQRECRDVFHLMVRSGLVAAVFLSPEEAPRLPSILEH